MQRRAFLKRLGVAAGVVASGGLASLAAVPAPEFTVVELGGAQSAFDPLGPSNFQLTNAKLEEIYQQLKRDGAFDPVQYEGEWCWRFVEVEGSTSNAQHFHAVF